VRQVLASRCFGCHAGKDGEAGLDLSRLVGEDGQAVLGAFRLWEKIVHRVAAGEMPPEGARPLSDDQRHTLTEWHRRTFIDLLPRPGPSGPRRLTRTEYRNTLADLLGIPLRPGSRELFYQADHGSIVEKLLPADPPGPSGFDNDASVLSLGPAEFGKYLQIAEYAVRQLDSLPEARRALLGDGAVGPATSRERARSILARFAARAFRHPVADDELAPFLAVFDAADEPPAPEATADSREASFLAALQEALTAVLVSPKFLYRLEGSRGPEGPYRITDHELATRLSYFLWSTMPDEELFRLAEEGRLHEAETLGRQVDRMLADPRGLALAENFGGQ
jgi:hypothetical protein